MTEQAQAQKLRFLEDFMRVTDENIIAKLSDVLQQERIKRAKTLRKMTHEELAEKLNRAEDAQRMGQVKSHEEVVAYFEAQRSRAAD